MDIFELKENMENFIKDYEKIITDCKYAHGVNKYKVREEFELNTFIIPVESYSIEFMVVAQDTNLRDCSIIITPDFKIYFKVKFSRSNIQVVEVRTVDAVQKRINNLKFKDTI